MPVQPDKARRILALRALLIAWTHYPQASVYKQLVEALAVGEQYEPHVTVRELTSLWPMMSELFGPLPRRLPVQPRRLPAQEVTDVQQG